MRPHKTYLFTLLSALLLTTFAAQAQIFNPVKWHFSAEAKGDGQYDLLFKAELEPHWHIYSQHLPSEDGPIATSFAFTDNADIELIGEVKEPKPHKEHDPNFDMMLSWFEEEVTFVQRVKLKNGSGTTVKGEITYMVCDPSKCLPPEYPEFAIELEPQAEATADANTVSINLTDANEAAGEQDEANQIFDPVKWEHKAEKLDNGDYALTITAAIEPGWHLYSQELPSEDGPIATEVLINGDGVEAVGKAIEVGDRHTDFDPNFEMDLNFYEGEVSFMQRIKAKDGIGKAAGSVYFMVCDDKRCLPPTEVLFDFDLTTAAAYSGQVPGFSAETLADDGTAGGSESEDSQDGLFAIFFIGFLAGFAALFTPCVFPMIPLTVSFFTKQSTNKAKGISNAAIYGLSIIGIYTLLGVIITAAFGVDGLHEMSTGVVFNLFIFAVLVIFAISFFGAFELTLPTSWVNKMDQASDKGGLLGIFFMAATLSIVSFSCTGPIIGGALASSIKEGLFGPAVIMFGFSTALALPFTLFAIFPGWLNSLPKSGGWLNSVKVTLGFLELAFAFKFLSNADLVEQWHLLERELFIAIWVAVFGSMALYLFGFIKFPHDSPLDRLSVGRALTAIVVTIFTLYLIPGLFGAPLKLIAGFPPPDFYAEKPYGLYQEGGMAPAANIAQNGAQQAAPHSTGGHCPKNLNCFHDLEEGIAYAKEVNKPVMIDFTGWACVNCRKMEEQVWADKGVWNRLNEEFVLVSLYVDEKEKLPESEHFFSEVLDKKVTRVGQKWVDLQVSKYKSNAQPHYVITDHEGNQLHEATNYDPDIPKFIDWLDRGKSLFYDNSEKTASL